MNTDKQKVIFYPVGVLYVLGVPRIKICLPLEADCIFT